MKINLTFLGTGSAIPTANRNHIGILISFAAENILIDCGEGIQRQFRKAKLSPTKLTRIFITHWHADHTLGLPGLLETLAMSEYSKTLHIYGPKNTKQKLELFEKIYGKFKIKYEIHEMSKKTIETPEFIIESAEMKHGTPTNAYSLTIKDKLKINKTKLKQLKLPNSPLIKNIQQGKDIIHPTTLKKIKAKSLTYTEKGKKLTIILDTSENSQAINLAKNSDLLICESSFLSNSENGDKLAKEYQHLTAKQAGAIAKKSKSKFLILTHISQRYDKSNSEILKEAKKVFKNTKITEDLDNIEI